MSAVQLQPLSEVWIGGCTFGASCTRQTLIQALGAMPESLVLIMVCHWIAHDGRGAKRTRGIASGELVCLY